MNIILNFLTEIKVEYGLMKWPASNLLAYQCTYRLYILILGHQHTRQRHSTIVWRI